VVVDFKGENYLETAADRRRMGHKVVLLDPYRIVTSEPDTFNPLQFIDRESPTAIDECRDLAEALVVRTGQEKDPHWNDAAEVWISAMTAGVVAFADDTDKSLQSVRRVLTDPQRMEAVIKLLCESDVWDGMLARLGGQLTNFKDKELSSTLTTTNRFMRFLDTIAVAESTRQSSFNPADLLTGKMTVYLVLPPEHMRAQSPLLRLWISSLLRAVVKGGLQEKTKVHFVLDEAASLGHMEALDDAVDKFRGYGVRLQLYYQSIGQLQKCWPDGGATTLLSNTTQVFFGVNDPQTAGYVSSRLGEETILVESGGTSSSTTRQASQQGSGSYSYSTSTSDNWQQMGRKLLKPEEVEALDPRVAITFTPSAPPIWTWLVRYYEKDFGRPQGLGPVKAAFDAACLFLAAGLLAVWWTAALFYHTFQ
jgi:type IV secretion system protein VirD4